MSTFLRDSANILTFGAIGLELLLGFLSYSLLVSAMRRVTPPPPTVLNLIKLFMVLCLTLAVLGLVAESLKPAITSSSWTSSLDKQALTGFEHGGDATRLKGNWDGYYYAFNPDGATTKPYQIQDKTSGRMIDYPAEHIYVAADGSRVTASTRMSAGGSVKTWAFGKLSTGDDVILIDWCPGDGPQEKLVGVNFLHLEEQYDGTATLSGWWVSRTRNGQVTRGTTIWKRVSE